MTSRQGTDTPRAHRGQSQVWNSVREVLFPDAHQLLWRPPTTRPRVYRGAAGGLTRTEAPTRAAGESLYPARLLASNPSAALVRHRSVDVVDHENAHWPFPRLQFQTELLL